jgi:hypothetical protein
MSSCSLAVRDGAWRFKDSLFKTVYPFSEFLVKFPLINDEIHVWKAPRTGDLLPRKSALLFGTVYNMHIALAKYFYLCVPNPFSRYRLKCSKCSCFLYFGTKSYCTNVLGTRQEGSKGARYKIAGVLLYNSSLGHPVSRGLNYVELETNQRQLLAMASVMFSSGVAV